MAASVRLLYEDEHLLVADKPAGKLSVPAPGVEARSLLDDLRAAGKHPLPVHRLDRETSGAILFARDPETRAALEEMFRTRSVDKTYWAMASGRFREPQGVYSYRMLEERGRSAVNPRGQEAETRWRVLAAHSVATELEIELVTGRTNQIRVHCAHAGHPLIGERKYARGKASPLPLRSRRVALHAWRLSFAHPRGGARVEVEAPLPEDLLELRARAAAGARP
ncbi:MAG: RluA family pseudouridine synthase [Planctomycetota bacterium]|nr:RluA family pseudouridine synthase [Planctomycetota bacterium]